MEKKYLIIGSSAAGVAAALTFRRLDGSCSISILSQEPEIPYNKCLLADYAHGEKSEEQLTILTKEAAQVKNIQMHLGITATAIDRSSQKVLCSDGQEFSYDMLFLATGASPFVPPIEGLSSHPYVFNFYRLSDVSTILTTLKEKKMHTALVVGAGLSGLECADALHAQGLSVTVVERFEHVLGKQVDQQGAQCIQTAMRNRGIVLYTETSVMHVNKNTVSLSNGISLQADLIVCAVGVVPNVILAENAYLKIEDGSVWVSDTMQTSDPIIYAGGDCCMVTDQLSGKRMRNCSWPEAMQQGMIAAHNMIGIEKRYLGACVITSSAFFGVKFATCGMINDLSAEYEVRFLDNQSCYLKVVVLDDRVCGYVLVGDTRHASALRRLILTGESFEKYAHTLFNNNLVL